MRTHISRAILVVASLLLIAGGVMHAAAFRRVVAAVAASDLDAFFANSLKMLWLADSANMLGLAAVCAVIALRPSASVRGIVLILASIPAATAVLLYTFLGNFFAGHLLLSIAVAMFVAGLVSQPFATESDSCRERRAERESIEV